MTDTSGVDAGADGGRSNLGSTRTDPEEEGRCREEEEEYMELVEGLEVRLDQVCHEVAVKARERNLVMLDLSWLRQNHDTVLSIARLLHGEGMEELTGRHFDAAERAEHMVMAHCSGERSDVPNPPFHVSSEPELDPDQEGVLEPPPRPRYLRPVDAPPPLPKTLRLEIHRQERKWRALEVETAEGVALIRRAMLSVLPLKEWERIRWRLLDLRQGSGLFGLTEATVVESSLEEKRGLRRVWDALHGHGRGAPRPFESGLFVRVREVLQSVDDEITRLHWWSGASEIPQIVGSFICSYQHYRQKWRHAPLLRYATSTASRTEPREFFLETVSHVIERPGFPLFSLPLFRQGLQRPESIFSGEFWRGRWRLRRNPCYREMVAWERDVGKVAEWWGAVSEKVMEELKGAAPGRPDPYLSRIASTAREALGRNGIRAPVGEGRLSWSAVRAGIESACRQLVEWGWQRREEWPLLWEEGPVDGEPLPHCGAQQPEGTAAAAAAAAPLASPTLPPCGAGPNYHGWIACHSNEALTKPLPSEVEAHMDLVFQRVRSQERGVLREIAGVLLSFQDALIGLDVGEVVIGGDMEGHAPGDMLLLQYLMAEHSYVLTGSGEPWEKVPEEADALLAGIFGGFAKQSDKEGCPGNFAIACKCCHVVACTQWISRALGLPCGQGAGPKLPSTPPSV
eukprot:Hpha_TRINITY_DN31039_c0_g1::TRINITY_DN31039_c0_g1_i1::g.63991::m.63991